MREVGSGLCVMCERRRRIPRTLDGGVLFLKEGGPLALVEVEYVQIVELLGDLIYAAKDDKILAVKHVAGVAAPLEGVDPVHRLNLLPGIRRDVIAPEVVKLVVVVVSPPEDPHGTLVDHSRVAAARLRHW
jgi:hypothetical protein